MTLTTNNAVNDIYLTTQFGQAFSAAGGSSSFQTLSFSNANGASFSNNAGQVQLSYTVPSTAGLISAVNVSAGTTSNNLSALTFNNSNGVSFGLNGSVITGTVATNYQSQGAYLTTAALSQDSSKYAGTNAAITNGSITVNTSGVSVNVPAQTNQTLSFVATGNTTQNTTLTADARSLTINGLGGVTVGFSNGSINISGATPTGGGGGVALSAGTNSTSTGTVVFSNSNGVSFGMETNGNITATVKTDYQSSNANYLTSQSNQNVTAANGGFAFQTLSFSNVNGFSFATSAGSAIVGSYTVPTVTNSSWTVSDAGTSGTVARLAFTNINGVTLSLSTGAGGSHTIVGSHNGLTSQSNQNVTAANGGFAFQTLSFSNVNGFSFGTSAGSAITGSYTVPSTAGLISAINVSGGTTSNNLSAITFNNANGVSFGLNASVMTASVSQTNQTEGWYAVSNTTQGTSGTVDARSVSIAGAGIASVGITNGSIVVSVPAQGATGAFTGGVSNLGNTGGLTGGVSNLLVFAGGNNITLSQTAILGSATISIIGAAGGGGATLSRSIWPAAQLTGISNAASNGSQSIQYFPCPAYLSATRADIMGSCGLSTVGNGSSISIDMTRLIGVYTRNASTLSLLSSGSVTERVTYSSSNNSANVQGYRLYSIPITMNMTPGDYFVMANMSYAASVSTASGTGPLATQSYQITIYGGGQIGTANNFVDNNAATATSINLYLGMGIVSVTSNAVPSSIALSDIQATGTTVQRANIAIQFRG